jgi:hypothetical protein
MSILFNQENAHIYICFFDQNTHTGGWDQKPERAIEYLFLPEKTQGRRS